jgi:uncharacterized membrane protein
MKSTNNNDYRLDVSTLKRDWIIILVIVICFVTGVLVYPQLPERVPSHWNIHGEIDGYSSRMFGAFGIPGMLAGLYVLFLVMPIIDPKRKNYALFSGVYSIFKLVFTLFMAGVYFVTIVAGLGYDVDTGLVISIGISLLFMVMGNTMGRVKHNYFFGVKTPWTLANEEVWRKTHRLSGRLFVASGTLTLITTLISRSAGFWMMMGSIIVFMVISTVYSYVLFKKLEK